MTLCNDGHKSTEGSLGVTLCNDGYKSTEGSLGVTLCNDGHKSTGTLALTVQKMLDRIQIVVA